MTVVVPSVSPPILFTLEVNSLNLLHHLTSIYFTTVLCSKDQLRTAETRAHQPVLSHRHRRRAEAQRDERKQCNGCKRLLPAEASNRRAGAERNGHVVRRDQQAGQKLLEEYGPDPQ